MKAVMMEEDAGGRIDVRVRVLGLHDGQHVLHKALQAQKITHLSVLLQDIRGYFRVLLDELKERILGDLRSGRSKSHESFESRIGFSQHAMAVPGNDLS